MEVSFIRSPERLDGEILRIKELNLTAKRVYSLVRFCQGNGQPVSLATSWISSRLAVSRQAVSRAVGQLRRRKLLTVDQRPRQTTIFSAAKLSGLKNFFLYLNSDNSGHSESEMLIVSYLKYRQGENDYAWPHIKTICSDLGMSKSSVLRSLGKLEQSGVVSVKHAHGGLKQGNKYLLTSKALNVSFCNPKIESGVSNRDTINNTSEEFKTHNTKSSPAPQVYQEKIQLLRQYGVALPVAKSLAAAHETDDIRNAVLNAVAQCQQRRTNDPRLARAIKIGGYIVATLNKARREGHSVVQNSFVRRELQKHKGKPREAFDALKAERLKALAAEQIRRLRAVVALEEAHRITGVA